MMLQLPEPGMALVVDAIAEPFVVIGRDYRIVAANRGYLARNGYHDVQAVVGRLCYEAGRCRRDQGGCGLEAAFNSGGEFTGSGVSAYPDETERYCRRRCIPLTDAQGRVAYVGEFFADVGRGTRLVARSVPMAQAVAGLERLAGGELHGLITGARGVGKERAARYLHGLSRRRRGPFVAVDCEAPESGSLDADLFGSADVRDGGRAGAGLVAAADGGTLYLAGIGGLAKSLQVKLLRMIETGEYRRRGSNRPWRADVRVLASSTTCLYERVEEGRFDAGLFERLSALPVRIPGLCERPEDLEPLARDLLVEVTGDPGATIDGEALEPLRRHPFPGNVRELRKVLERAVALAGGNNPITSEHIRFGEPVVETKATGDDLPVLERRSGRLRPRQVLEALERCGGYRAEAARLLGVSERTVYRYVVRLKGEA